MSQLSSEHMSHAGVYEQLKRCQVVENGMVRTWLSRWSVAARFPGMCRTIDEFRWCAQHMAHCLLPPAETKMVRRLKFNLRSLGKDSLREVVNVLLFLRDVLQQFAKEYKLPDRPRYLVASVAWAFPCL